MLKFANKFGHAINTLNQEIVEMAEFDYLRHEMIVPKFSRYIRHFYWSDQTFSLRSIDHGKIMHIQISGMALVKSRVKYLFSTKNTDFNTLLFDRLLNEQSSDAFIAIPKNGTTFQSFLKKAIAYYGSLKEFLANSGFCLQQEGSEYLLYDYWIGSILEHSFEQWAQQTNSSMTRDLEITEIAELLDYEDCSENTNESQLQIKFQTHLFLNKLACFLKKEDQYDYIQQLIQIVFECMYHDEFDVPVKKGSCAYKQVELQPDGSILLEFDFEYIGEDNKPCIEVSSALLFNPIDIYLDRFVVAPVGMIGTDSRFISGQLANALNKYMAYIELG